MGLIGDRNMKAAMPKKEFRVGTTEKHTILVDVSVWTGRVKILVDGREIPSHKVAMSKFAPDFNTPSRGFMVGVNEQHQVEARISPGMPLQLEIYVDGKSESKTTA